MIKQLFIFLLLALVIPAKAEYNGYHLRIVVTDTKGRTTAGYVYVAEYYIHLDSLNNTLYLKQALNQDYSRTDTFTFYSHRITYRYVPIGYEGSRKNKASIYYLLDPVKLPFTTISRIEVRNMSEFSYLSGIAGEFRLRDTTWMKNEPVKQASFGGYLCSYELFIHKSSKKVEKLLQELEAKQKEYELLEEMDPNFYEDEGRRNGDEKDKVFSELIDKFMGEKVVVIAFCSC